MRKNKLSEKEKPRVCWYELNGKVCRKFSTPGKEIKCKYSVTQPACPKYLPSPKEPWL